MQSLISIQQFKGYDSVMNLQIPMLKQILKWLIENRISIDNGILFIKNAKYEIDTFIPNLEVSDVQSPYFH
jgi:hypothetical protein